MLAAASVVAMLGPVAVGTLEVRPLKAQTGEKLAFEVASVRKGKFDLRAVGNGLRFLPGGRMVAHGVPFWYLIVTAYGVPFQSNRITGGPEWARDFNVSYDIEAVAPKGAIPDGATARERDRRMRLMLLALLAERFKMSVRSETKELPVYAVTVRSGGVKLEKSDKTEKECGAEESTEESAGCHGWLGGMGRGIHGKAMSIEDIANAVSNWSDRQVVDQTGLAELYKVDTEGWAPMVAAPPRRDGELPSGEAVGDPARPTLFQVFDKMGMKLESKKAPVKMFVIERAERPTEN